MTKKNVASNRAALLLENRFSTASSTRRVCVLLIDEMDYIMTRKQNVIYNFFDWSVHLFALPSLHSLYAFIHSLTLTHFHSLSLHSLHAGLVVAMPNWYYCRDYACFLCLINHCCSLITIFEKVVIGIANTMDLPERLMPRVHSRLGW